MKARNIILMILIGLIYSESSGQINYKLDWVKTYSWVNESMMSANKHDKKNNLYTIGTFSGNVNFDPGPSTYNLQHWGLGKIFIQKTNELGNLKWVITFGESTHAIDVAVDDFGNINTLGKFNGTANVHPGSSTYNLISNGNSDYYIHKVDSNGNFLWAKSFGGKMTDIPIGIQVDKIGNTYITGHYKDTVDFDPGIGTQNLVAIGDYDIFIQKLDPSGNLLWAKSFGSYFNDQSRTLTIDNSGNIYIAGIFSGIIDFDPGPGVVNLSSFGGYTDSFIIKLDSAGNLGWAKAITGPFGEAINNVKIDQSKNVIISGTFSGTSDFDPDTGVVNLTSNGGSDIFIQKLDSNGNFIWVKSFGSTNMDIINGTSLDSNGNVYIVGDFHFTVDFDPGIGISNLSPNGFSDIFLLKLDQLGNYIWATSLGGIGKENIKYIYIDNYSNIYATGFFDNTVDFYPGAGTAIITPYATPGIKNAFMLKLNPCITKKTSEVVIACRSFTWIDGITYYTCNKEAKYSFVGSTGCDSTINLNLKVLNVSDVSTSLSNGTIIANNNNATYQWINCTNGFSLIPGATGQTFTPNNNGSYAVIIYENDCSDTSDCVLINSIGYEENNISKEILLYPNPSDGEINLVFNKNLEVITVSTYNTLGQIFSRKSYTNISELKLSLKTEPRGIYFIEINSNEFNKIFRLILE